MILWLLERFELEPLRNLFRYLTVRAALAAAVAFCVAVGLGKVVIRWLRARRIAERVEKTDSEFLAVHHQAKAGTPTMGGVLIVTAVLVSVLAAGRLESAHVQLALLATFAFGLLGALDDWVKLTRSREKGLAARVKFLAQTAIAAALASAVLVLARRGGDEAAAHVLVPFFKNLALDLSAAGGLPYVLFGLVVVVGTSNAVNLTDGLDGLATGCSAIAAAAFGIVLYVIGRADFARYLWIPHVPGAAELTIVCAALAGACLGFLWFNAFPAEVFMGDTGSLAIGGLLGYVALVAHQELVLAIVCGVFVIEAASVVAQVTSFRLRGRRVLLCAPVHHHFQMKGWHEVKIVVRLWIVAVLCAMAGLATLKLR